MWDELSIEINHPDEFLQTPHGGGLLKLCDCFNFSGKWRNTCRSYAKTKEVKCLLAKLTFSDVDDKAVLLEALKE